MSQSWVEIVPIKITLVDEAGLILLDTLINPCTIITHSCEQIHGIKPAWLLDAPNLRDVREHIKSSFSSANFVGHSVRHDLKALGIPVPYVDTAYFEDIEERQKEIPGLKYLSEKYLNAKI